MYLVIQSRWIRDSSQSGENVVWAGYRKKEGIGQLTASLYSHFDMMKTHNYFDCPEVEVDPSIHEIVGADAIGVRYRIRYTLVEVPDDIDNYEIRQFLDTRVSK